jgi:hypothetical protein
MPEPVVVSIPHALGKAEALRRLKPGFARATANIPLLKFDEQTWTNNRMAFRAYSMGQVVSGTVDVGESDVRLEVCRGSCRGSQEPCRPLSKSAHLLLEKKS